MITDVLFRRYPERWLYTSQGMEPLSLLVRQAAIIFFDDITPNMPNQTRLYEVPEKRLARELGEMVLGQQLTAEQRVVTYLSEPYDIWHGSHGDADNFIKLRMSLLELLFREAETILAGYAPNEDVGVWWALLKKRLNPPKGMIENALAATMTGIEELNNRFKNADFPFEYHNGLIQRVDDPLTTEQIEHPFWELVASHEFSNIDSDMKEAIDRRDSGKPGAAAFHALKALESALKIVSNDLGLTRGKENGASDYVDNLVSENNGRFIEVWEAETLKYMFRNLRNPLGHGPGPSDPLNLTEDQATWVIEQSMSWIKSLIRRKS